MAVDDAAAQALADRLMAGDRRALSRSITLVESARADHRATAAALLDAVAGGAAGTLRVGISGTPGVGKSSLIEALGTRLTGQGHRVAVLAVDPSSARSGGAILGDKTRMPRLAQDRAAFIRPSPAQRQLGGVARRTREAVTLCEAAGFDIVIVETVGVGQSETAVAAMTDLFVLMLAPGGGDELQGVKRGIMEMADLILINKADGALRDTAFRTRADYAAALRLLRARPHDAPGFPQALALSAETGEGLAEAWDAMTDLADWRRDHGHLGARRADQARHWFEAEVRDGLLARLDTDPEVRERMARLGQAVAAGETAPARAAQGMLDWLAGETRVDGPVESP